MDDIMTVRDLIAELEQRDPDLPVMIAVVKYPEEFNWKESKVDGTMTWMDSTDVEVHPLEHGEVTMQENPNMLVLAVELMDYDAQRHFAGG